MTDLRTKIAAAAYNAYSGQWAEWESVNETHRNDWLEVADAVIRELCIHREDMNEWAVLAEGFRGHRYVTHWEPNDDR